MKLSTAVISAALLVGQTNAFAPQLTTRQTTSLFLGPDQPFQDNSMGRNQPLQADPGLRSNPEQDYQARGRNYYPEEPRVQEPGPMAREPVPPIIEPNRPLQPAQTRPTTNQWGDEVLQGGGSRKTWTTSHHDQTIVQIGSAGRPIYTEAAVWEGPNNSPARMSLYSEDGGTQPWNAAFQNKGRSSVMDLKNTGPLEFPVDVNVLGQHDGTRGMGKYEKDATTQYYPSPEKVTQTVQGQSLSYFNVKAGVSAVKVELFSEGRPMYANVELWQGPSNIKQCAEIYSDNGNDRVWSAVIETHGRECTVAIRNVGPMAYPMKASVDPIYER